MNLLYVAPRGECDLNSRVKSFIPSFMGTDYINTRDYFRLRAKFQPILLTNDRCTRLFSRCRRQ